MPSKDMNPQALELLEIIIKYCKENLITAEDFATVSACVTKEFKKLYLR